jgi:hypothetical protein
MNWQIVSAACAAVGMLMAGLNAYQNVRIELKVELLRNDLLTKEIGPLKERIATLEAQLEPLRANCPILHTKAA